MGLTYADYDWDHRGHGWRQKDLTVTQVYDRRYLADRYEGIDDRVRGLADKRLQVLSAFAPSGDALSLLDFGAGTYRFAEAVERSGLWRAYGCDVTGVYHRLRLDAITCQTWDVVTFFDSMEHLTDPAETVRALGAAWVMVSVPECHHPHAADWFMGWKHRRPGEHLWHWNRQTLDGFFRLLGYRPVMHSWFEDEFRPNPEQAEPNILTAIYRRA